MRPEIYACGNYAGKSIPGGVSFIDVPAGSCEITIPSQMYPGERDLIVKLAPGETKYVISWIGASGLGGRANMEEVSEERTKKEMEGLALVGRN